MLQFHNTLSGRTEEFRPLREGEVRFYYCGPTVWNYGHIGNFRSAVAADILRRYLKFKGYKVTHVMNSTEVEDRIIAKSQEAGLSIDDYTAQYIDALWEDFDALGCERPEVVPRATRHIPEMVDLIQRLLETGHAYKSDGSIYYRISSFPEYGKLSKINFAGNIAGGSERIDTDRYEKEDARDFALWKEPASPTEPAWDAPFGRGRPGWHIECSAMSMKYLGETFDLHCGGEDLIFPHHENEIAQSQCGTGKPFVRHWMHVKHLLVEGETMSKSKGNFFLVPDLLERGHSADSIRYLLAGAHYRKPLNFTFEGLSQAATALDRVRGLVQRLGEAAREGPAEPAEEAAREARKVFAAALADDLNTPEAVAAVFGLVTRANTLLAEGAMTREGAALVQGEIESMDSVFGVLLPAAEEDRLSPEEQALFDERQDARKNREFARADAARARLEALGVVLEDTPKGTRWRRKR